MRVRNLAAIAAISLAARTFAAGVYEPFNYPYTTPPPGTSLDGQVNPSTGGQWYRMGALTEDEILIAQNNLFIDGLAAPMGNSIAYQGIGKTQRLGLGTPGVTTGTAYYSLAFQLTALTDLANLPNGVFVAGFNNVMPTAGQNGHPTAIGARLYLKVGTTPDTFLIGLAKNTSTATEFVFDTVERQLNTPIFIVGSYTINAGATNNDVAQMWINPDKSLFAGNAPLPETATLTASVGNDLPAVASFLFRQQPTGAVVGVPDVNADELRVDASWAGVTGVGWVPNQGQWGNSANWTGGTVPDLIGAEVNFTPTPFASPLPINVQVDGIQKTVGTINFSSPERVTVDCCGMLILQSPSGNSSLHRASINVFAGSHVFNTPVRLASNTTINIAPADSTLSMGIDSVGATPRLTKSGAGKLELGHLDVDDFVIAAGSVAFKPTANGNRTNTFTMADGTSLDLSASELELKAGSASVLDSIEALIATGRAGGQWTGTGISSSAARNNSLRTTGIAAILNDNGQGVPVNALYELGSVVMKYTFDGDSDLDLDVDADDYARINQGFAQGHSGYYWGDFNYDGLIDADDFFLIDRAFSNQDVAAPVFRGAAVPEPSAVTGITLGLLLAAGRRYRRHKRNDCPVG